MVKTSTPGLVEASKEIAAVAKVILDDASSTINAYSNDQRTEVMDSHLILSSIKEPPFNVNDRINYVANELRSQGLTENDIKILGVEAKNGMNELKISFASNKAESIFKALDGIHSKDVAVGGAESPNRKIYQENKAKEAQNPRGHFMN